MNCKQGDLAYIIREPYLGHFVDVMRWATNGDILPNGNIAVTSGSWLCKKLHGVFDAENSHRTEYATIPDQYLRPIRDQPGEDEMIRIAGLPNKQPEVA